MNNEDKRLAFAFAMAIAAVVMVSFMSWREGHLRGFCEGAGGTITAANSGWYCRGDDGRVLETVR